MATLRINKTNFTAGEISPDLLGRGDLRAYENGANLLKNVFVNPTGGLSRRPGLRYISTISGPGRLVAFEFNTEQIYLLVFTDRKLSVYRDDIQVASARAPWTESQLAQISWVQSADTLLVTHPDTQPRKITRTSETAWTVSVWSYVEKAGRILQPFHKFAQTTATLSTSARRGSITVTANTDVFVAAHVGTRFRITNKELEITRVISATVARALVKETLPSTSAVEDWEEQAFSAVRGWPVSVCFHQDRLVIGGSRDLPNRLWLSKSSDIYNFDLGQGLDDAAIDFAILSDQVNAVRAVFSGRHLQVFTSGAEWMVSGDPLTPENIQLHRQTRIGSPIDRTVPPRDVDGATLFVPRDGNGLREFLFADVEQAYQAHDLAMLAKHMVNNPLDQDYDTTRRLLHLVLQDGTLSTVTVFRAEQVTAWSRQQTSGLFRSLCVTGDDTFVLVERRGSWFLEKFDQDVCTDSALVGTSETAKLTWVGLNHLDGETVAIRSDGAVHESRKVSRGRIALDYPSTNIEAGLAFAHCIEPLPPTIQVGGGPVQGRRLRPVSHTFRLLRVTSLRLDTGQGFIDVPFRRLGAQTLDTAPKPFTGDRTIRAFGWRGSGIEPLWRIENDAPLPFNLLSVSSEVSING